jgi:hypothetical protein
MEAGRADMESQAGRLQAGRGGIKSPPDMHRPLDNATSAMVDMERPGDKENYLYNSHEEGETGGAGGEAAGGEVAGGDLLPPRPRTQQDVLRRAGMVALRVDSHADRSRSVDKDRLRPPHKDRLRAPRAPSSPPVLLSTSRVNAEFSRFTSLGEESWKRAHTVGDGDGGGDRGLDGGDRGLDLDCKGGTSWGEESWERATSSGTRSWNKKTRTLGGRGQCRSVMEQATTWQGEELYGALSPSAYSRGSAEEEAWSEYDMQRHVAAVARESPLCHCYSSRRSALARATGEGHYAPDATVASEAARLASGPVCNVVGGYLSRISLSLTHLTISHASRTQCHTHPTHTHMHPTELTHLQTALLT